MWYCGTRARQGLAWLYGAEDGVDMCLRDVCVTAALDITACWVVGQCRLYESADREKRDSMSAISSTSHPVQRATIGER